MLFNYKSTPIVKSINDDDDDDDGDTERILVP